MKAVILAGGFGTRLWPLSRKKHPKQFLKLTSEKTLLEDTIKQLSFLTPSDIYIATNLEYEPQVREISAGVIPPENILIEPDLRDTAACIGLITFTIAKKFPDEVISINYADHLIKKTENLKRELEVAEYIAKNEEKICIIEVPAKTPNTNFGYVKIGNKLGEISGSEIYEFIEFKEKPDLDTAKKFLADGNFLWNTGRFVWKASTIIEKYREHAPDLYEALITISKSIGTPEEAKVTKEIYPTIRKISVDYAIMEKLKPDEVKIIKADLDWSDIGTFETLFDESPQDDDKNVIKAKTINENTKNCIIISNTDRLIATVGIDNLAIIDTNDALLICDKKTSGDIKKVIETIKTNHPELL